MLFDHEFAILYLKGKTLKFVFDADDANDVTDATDAMDSNDTTDAIDSANVIYVTL